MATLEKKRRSKRRRRKTQKRSFGKNLMVAMILLCLEIVIFSEVAMIYLSDLSSLYALIGIVASLAVAIWAYSEKSAKENTKGGITYDLAMMSQTPPGDGDDPDNEEVNENEL